MARKKSSELEYDPTKDPEVAADLELCPYCCDENHLVFMDGEYVPCPIHGNMVSQAAPLLDMDNEQNVYNILSIPLRYRNSPFLTGDMFFKGLSNRKDFRAESRQYFSDILTQIAGNISSKGASGLRKSASDLSYLLCVDDGVELENYIYPLLVQAYLNGYRVVPFISLNGLQIKADCSHLEFYGSSRLNDTTLKDYIYGLNQSYIEDNPFSYSNYVQAEVLFLRLPRNLTSQLINVLGDLLDERAMRNLPTFVVGTLDHYFALNSRSKSMLDLKNLTATQKEGSFDSRLSRLQVQPLIFEKKVMSLSDLDKESKKKSKVLESELSSKSDEATVPEKTVAKRTRTTKKKADDTTEDMFAPLSNMFT